MTGSNHMIRFFMDMRALENFIHEKMDDLEEGF